MIRLLLCSFMLLLCFSCKSDKNQSQDSEQVKLTTAEKIAKAHGIDHWKNVSQIEFTFNVDRDTTHFERSWTWKPKTGEVTLISGKDTISYNRKSVDSIALNADKAFVNDKYWLLAPYHLVWDSGITISESVIEEAPINKSPLNKITLTYSNDGGYTPGDAYDFYYDDKFMIQEWVYRQGNATEPSMISTWEDYETFNNLIISKSHKKPEGNWNLHFTSIKVSE